MGLDSVLNDKYYPTRYIYKSEGERRIARMLEDSRIDFVYEPGLLVNDAGKQRIWYPDFGLPRYAVYIEYFGLENDPVYAARTHQKLEVYRENRIEVVPLYPGTLRGDYRSHVLHEVRQIQQARLADLESVIYNRSPRPIYKRSCTQLGMRRSSGGYR